MCRQYWRAVVGATHTQSDTILTLLRTGDSLVHLNVICTMGFVWRWKFTETASFLNGFVGVNQDINVNVSVV